MTSRSAAWTRTLQSSAAMPEVASAGGVIVGNVNVSGSFYFLRFWL